MSFLLINVSINCKFKNVSTNRLKMVIGDTISINQSTFMPGRLISDNVMISHEWLSFI